LSEHIDLIETQTLLSYFRDIAQWHAYYTKFVLPTVSWIFYRGAMEAKVPFKKSFFWTDFQTIPKHKTHSSSVTTYIAQNCTYYVQATIIPHMLASLRWNLVTWLRLRCYAAMFITTQKCPRLLVTLFITAGVKLK